jgi:hypothetical protein
MLIEVSDDLAAFASRGFHYMEELWECDALI